MGKTREKEKKNGKKYIYPCLGLGNETGGYC